MFSFPLVFTLLAVPKFLCLKLTCSNFFASSSRKFLQLFELWKILYSEVAQKITKKLYSKFSGKKASGGTFGWPGGPPPSQKARWRGPAPGRATHPPGWVPCPLVASLPSLSLFLLKNTSSSSGFFVLAVLELVSSISSSSHLFELISWTSAPWYVTPSPLQLVF